MSLVTDEKPGGKFETVKSDAPLKTWYMIGVIAVPLQTDWLSVLISFKEITASGSKVIVPRIVEWRSETEPFEITSYE